ncbi:flagellar filament capping protein FliD, partial [Acinetobacter baumannii]|uniref:flagellar filament capping protein FliD n=1 Tax=Acinetobacter baumannii TaxID=470 RepID=UPI00148A7395
SGELSVLAQLGVTTNKDGTLSIDDAKLSSALETHYDEVQAFFVGDDGLIPRLNRSPSLTRHPEGCWPVAPSRCKRP